MAEDKHTEDQIGLRLNADREPAERLAAAMGVSVYKLCQLAVREYLERHGDAPATGPDYRQLVLDVVSLLTQYGHGTSVAERRTIVRVLLEAGYSYTQIGGLFSVSRQMIAQDVKAISAVASSPG